MRNRWHKSIALGTTFLLTAVLAAMNPLSAAADLIRWAPDLETAQAQASREGRLVLVHFWSDDCPPCRRLETNVFSRPEVAQAIAAKYVPVKVHAKRRSDLSQRFGVNAWPTDVVITPSGQKITSMVSPQDPQQYVQTFTHIASNMLPPTPATQTAGLAPQPTNEPYSNAFTGTNPLSATGNRPPSRYSPTGNPALAQNSARGAEAPWSEGNSTGVQNGEYTPQANGSVYGGNPGNGPPQSTGSANGNRYGGDYGAAQATYGEGTQYDYNPPAGNSTASRYQGGAQPTAAPQPQVAPYQPGYANQAAPAQHTAVSEPAPQVQSTYNPYANVNQAPAANAAPPAQGQQPPQMAANTSAGDQRRQVWEWDRQQQGSAAPAGQSQQAVRGEGRGEWGADTAPMAAQQHAHPQHQHAAQQSPQQARQPQQVANAPQQAPAPQGAAGHPPMALDGFCPVALKGKEPAWVKGDPAYGAVHRGRTYLFSSQTAQQQFLQDPDSFAPALSGYDPVRFVEQKQVVPGVRQFGWFYKGQYYLFADEAGLRRFEKSPDMYHGVVQQAMQGGPGQQQSPGGTQYR